MGTQRASLRSTRAFSLIELLSVLAIISVLAVATVPALKGTLDGFNISGAADMAGAELSLARQTAMSRNLPVEVRIYEKDDGTGKAYRVIALVIPGTAIGPTAEDEWVTGGKLLPGNVLFEYSGEFSTLISKKIAYNVSDPVAPWEKTESLNAPNLVRGMPYVAFQYKPDGSTNLPTGQPWCLTLKNLRYKPPTSNGPAANYVSIVLDSLTGRSLTYQPVILRDPRPLLLRSIGLAVILASTHLSAEDAPVTTPEGCVVEKFLVSSPSMGRDIEAAALLPPGYAKGTQKYPVIYALHGKDAPYLTYTDMTPLRKFLVEHPMVVVVFNADKDSCYLDATKRPKSLFTTFFFKELMPGIARRYRVDGQVAVSGFSMGGYGAMHYLLEQPGIFSSVSAMSGAFELFGDPGEREKDWRPWMDGLLGPRDKNLAAYEAVRIAPRLEKKVAAGTKLPPLLMLCGTGDMLLAGNRRFVDLLQTVNTTELAKHEAELKAIADPKERRARKEAIQKSALIDFEYRESPGGHDWPYWRDNFVAAAEFHWKHFAPRKE